LKRDTNLVKRFGPLLRPDPSRVLLRPFFPSTKEAARRILNQVRALSEIEAEQELESLFKEFGKRHENLEQRFINRWEQVSQTLNDEQSTSLTQQTLLGAYFSHEYSVEAAALFNPSIVPHPDQSGLRPGSLRFLLSLRSTGEGHISSLTFRTGVLDSRQKVHLTPTVPFLSEPVPHQNATIRKKLFAQKILALGVPYPYARRFDDLLPEEFHLEDLRRVLEAERLHRPSVDLVADKAAQEILLEAETNYSVSFDSQSQPSQRVLFPSTPSQSHGIEDVRLVHFSKDDGSFTYFGTYTAYDGRVTRPQLLETQDFVSFQFVTLAGAGVENKGMALFPRKINGHYVMLSRQDDQSLFIMESEDLRFWQSPKPLVQPSQPWELLKIGNCGSPIETSEGWLVLSHGVGAMRKYSLGAFLLDLDDPSRVLGRLRRPLLTANASEREGYVPNVVYTCGALVHGSQLVLPYAMSDSATGFGRVRLADLLKAMEKVDED
jgi:predicted GH43/DUF377 family glycosyl hydrolase